MVGLKLNRPAESVGILIIWSDMGYYLKLISCPIFVDLQFKRQSSATSSAAENSTSPGQLQSQLAQQEALRSHSTIVFLFGPKI